MLLHNFAKEISIVGSFLRQAQWDESVGIYGDIRNLYLIGQYFISVTNKIDRIFIGNDAAGLGKDIIQQTATFSRFLFHHRQIVQLFPSRNVDVLSYTLQGGTAHTVAAP